MPVTPRHLAIVVSVAILSHASMTFAQDEPPTTQVRAERVGIGVDGMLGLPGRSGSVRVSVPVTDRIGADFALGKIHGYGDQGQVAGGTSLMAQARWLWHGRHPDGHAGYWFYGAMFMDATNRTLIKWPNGTWTTKIDREPLRAGRLGYGWDWLSPHGARTGLELSWGGNEGGPMFFAHVFVVWGPERR